MKSKLTIYPSRTNTTALFTSLSINASSYCFCAAGTKFGCSSQSVVRSSENMGRKSSRSLGNGHLNQLDMAVQRKVNCSALVPSELPKYMLQQSALFWKSRTKSIANGNVVYWKLQPASSTFILVCEHRELCKTYFCCLFLRKLKLKKTLQNMFTVEHEIKLFSVD